MNRPGTSSDQGTVPAIRSAPSFNLDGVGSTTTSTTWRIFIHGEIVPASIRVVLDEPVICSCFLAIPPCEFSM